MKTASDITTEINISQWFITWGARTSKGREIQHLLMQEEGPERNFFLFTPHHSVFHSFPFVSTCQP